MTSNEKIEIVKTLIKALNNKEYDHSLLPDEINRCFENIETLKKNRNSMNAIEFSNKVSSNYIQINTWLCDTVDQSLNYFL